MFKKEERTYYSHLRALRHTPCCVELKGRGVRALNNGKCFLLDHQQVLPDWENVDVKEEARRSARVARGRKCPQAPTRGKTQNHGLMISCEILKLSHVWFSHYYKCQRRWRRYQEIGCPSQSFSYYVIWLPANACMCRKFPKENFPCL